LTIEPLEERRAPAAFVVTSTADDSSAATTAGTLRYAITQSNLTPGPNSIIFDIGTGGIQTIALTSPLPALTQQVSIFGGTQLTGTDTSGYSGAGIILNGAGAGAGDGFDVSAGNSTIEGIVIQGFTGHGIALMTNGGDELINDGIGTDGSLSSAVGNTKDGILINNVGNNVIQDCVISGNKLNGIEVTGANATNNLIGVGDTAPNANVGTPTGGGNFIGTDLTGTVGIANLLDGVYIHGSANGNYLIGNVVSANAGNGVHITGTGSVKTGTGTVGNALFGNYIGTDITGTLALGNSGDGVLIDGGANTNLIGDGNQSDSNVISANLGNGVHLVGTGAVAANIGTAANTVSFNFIGTDITGTLALGNAGDGVLIDSGANNNVIGGENIGNVISANHNGVHITGASTGAAGLGTEGNAVVGNFIGTDITGTKALGNTGEGILLDSNANTNTVGDDTTAGMNIISGNSGDGIHLTGLGTAKNTIQLNYIGVDSTGAVALGNGGAGILIDSAAANNMIGAEDSANIISANHVGVHISGGGTTGNTLLGNFIGTNAAGTGALGNTGDGVLIDLGASANKLGDDNAGGTNVISGNGGNGIHIAGTGAVTAGKGTASNVIIGNNIGADVTGGLAVPNGGDGILIDNGANANKIGDGSVPGVNVISGNLGNGIELNGSNLTLSAGQVGTASNVILGNYVGTDISGTNPLGNKGDGLLIDNGASNNSIGSDTTLNVFSANKNGIEISGTGAGAANSGTTGNILLANYIGTDMNGLSPVGNTGDGILLDNGAHGNKIGDGTAAGANVISANGAAGIEINGSNLVVLAGQQGTTADSILANLIGVNISGTGALGNAGDGVLIDNGASGNIIGATTSHNIISANLNGVHIAGAGTTGNIILNDYIGTDSSGANPMANTSDGVLIDTGASGNTVGATGTHNVISGNGKSGVHIEGTGAGAAGTGTTGNSVINNYIGTDLTGIVPLGNTGDGVLIDNGANGNQVGNGVAAGMNVISGNFGDGIHIDGSKLTVGTGRVGTSNNSVLDNYIGVDLTGAAAMANNIGVLINDGATGNTIGSTAAHNVISGNTFHGIEISGAGTTANVVLGNYIGLDKSGLKPLGNGSNGVMVDTGASNDTVGGAAAGARNYIVANGNDGVQIDGTGTTGNSVLGNYIGMDTTGKTIQANANDGVEISTHASGNTIGSTTTGAGNLISGNGNNGVEINTSSTGNFIVGNSIGVSATGTALGNTNDGVQVSSSGNTIGGETSGAGNVIQFNGGNGVTVVNGTGNAIQQNSIYSNGLLGIDLNDDGVKLNTPGGSTSGANNSENYPVVTSAEYGGAGKGTNITFTFNGAPNGTYQIELFDSPTANSSGYGEGKTPLTPVPITVTTDANGNAINPANSTDIFMVNIASGALPGTVVAGTATDASNNTSEFSQAMPVVSSAPVVDNVTFETDSHNHILGVVYSFSAPLAPSTVNASTFELFSAGPHALYNVPIKLAKTNPVVYRQSGDSFTVTVTPAAHLAAGHLIKAVAIGTGVKPVTSNTGVAIDGDYTGTLPSGDQIPGGDFDALMATGAHITYKDSHTNTISLTLTHGGLMEFIEPLNGAPGYLELAKIVTGKSILTGTVKAGKTGTGSTTLEAITGLTGVTDKLSSTDFTITDPGVTALDVVALATMANPLDMAAAIETEG
jgi:hypothetical protein